MPSRSLSPLPHPCASARARAGFFLVFRKEAFGLRVQQVGLSVGDTGRAKQRREFFIRMHTRRAGHRPFGMTDEEQGVGRMAVSQSAMSWGS